MREISIEAGRNKLGEMESFHRLHLLSGELYTIVGHTGSGKSRLIKDIEQLANGDSVTGRRIRLDGAPIEGIYRQKLAGQLVAHLGQNMRFVLDTTVEEFIALHARCRGREIATDRVLDMVNNMTAEMVLPEQNLNLLSGGQTRALMIADIALICDSPIVLIDEIENAGIDKEKALQYLIGQDKLVLVVTHDPHTALMAQRRIVLACGGITAVLERTEAEKTIYETLGHQYRQNQDYQRKLRMGVDLI